MTEQRVCLTGFHCTASRKVADSIPDEVTDFSIYLILPTALSPGGFTHHLSKCTARTVTGRLVLAAAERVRSDLSESADGRRHDGFGGWDGPH
jgi:hypothetical protein